MKYFLAACLLFFSALSAKATIVRPVTISELAKSSEQIVYGRIELAQIIAGDCGVRYVVTIEETYKGRWRPRTSVLFSSGKPLQVGSRYVLFLSKDSEAFSPLLSTNSFGPQPDPGRASLCQRNRPLYAVNVWGTAALEVTGTYASKVKLAFYDDFMIHMPQGAKVGKLEAGDRYDIERDHLSIEFGALRSILGGKPVPKHAPNNSSKPTPLRGAA
ncbi:hypothetical protein [Lysobacter xanthus]